jgi:CDP-diglyceride synthetase
MDDQERDGEQEPTVIAQGRVRIVGAEPAAAVVGGVADDRPPAEADEPFDEAAAEEAPVDPDAPSGTELPHWTEAPTGEIPAVLARGPLDQSEESDPWSSVPGPTWREEHTDWEANEETFEPAMLADDGGSGALEELATDERQPWTFDLPAAGEAAPAADAEERPETHDDTVVIPAVQGLDAAEVPPASDRTTAPAPVASAHEEPDGWAAEGAHAEVPTTGRWPGRRSRAGHAVRVPADAGAAAGDEEGDLRPSRRRRAERGQRPMPERPVPPAPDRPAPEPPVARRPVPRPRPGGGLRPPPPVRDGQSDRNLPVAVASGLALGIVALVFFKLGTVTAMIAVTAILALAAMEAYAAFRRAGYHPATLLGLAATVSLLVATYNKGQEAFPLVAVVLFVFTMLWHLARVDRAAEPVSSTAATLLVFAWIGVFGSFAALLLDPTLFPNRHGIAFVLGGVIAAVAYDVGALGFGAWLGRHPLTSVSPNKTWEGLIGGSVAAVVASVVFVHLIHPWTLGAAAALGLVVAVVSPIGDLSESLVKRNLGLKDMGRILPGHGGLLDRIDGLLFVMPATYYLVKAFHLG